MFKKSTTTKQLDLFSSPSGLMCKRESRKYDNPAAWHNKFYREVTCNIDEDIFRPLFAEEREDGRDDRPNAPYAFSSQWVFLKKDVAAVTRPCMRTAASTCFIVVHLAWLNLKSSVLP